MDTENLDELINHKRLVTYYLYRDAQDINIELIELPLDVGVQIRNQAIKKYFDSTYSNLVSPFVSKAFPDKWGIIGNVNDVPNNFLVFFDGYIDNHVIKFHDIKSFSKLVEETIAFDYYITNEDISFLIVWDSDHQILIGCGKAQEWVENLIQRHSENN